jgi:hypothetical protein
VGTAYKSERIEVYLVAGGSAFHRDRFRADRDLATCQQYRTRGHFLPTEGWLLRQVSWVEICTPECPRASRHTNAERVSRWQSRACHPGSILLVITLPALRAPLRVTSAIYRHSNPPAICNPNVDSTDVVADQILLQHSCPLYTVWNIVFVDSPLGTPAFPDQQNIPGECPMRVHRCSDSPSPANSVQLIIC